MPPSLQLIPARRGTASRVSKGQSIRIINTHGMQVVDTWAFVADDIAEHMSMEHTRARLSKLNPRVGDTFVTNRCNPILTLIEDTTPGNHDMLMPACNIHRYNKQYGIKGYHDNCNDNLRAGLTMLLGEEASFEFSPTPFNVFMNVPIKGGQDLGWEPSTAKKGQYIGLRAEMDLIVAFSACPNDVMSINGHVTNDAHFAVD